MHINITKSETGNNKGSSSQLVAYLEKENRLAEKLDRYHQPEQWFNHDRNNIQPYEVRQGIDNNVAKLSKDDAKFFLINISPSEKELLYLKEQYGIEGAKAYLKDYANLVMDAYARNFKRNGIDGNKDLVYYGKLEQNRYYTYKDLEVRKGKAVKGEIKPGEQMHIQIIVSRKDASNSIKLSPLNNSKGKNAAHSQKVGQLTGLPLSKYPKLYLIGCLIMTGRSRNHLSMLIRLNMVLMSRKRKSKNSIVSNRLIKLLLNRATAMEQL